MPNSAPSDLRQLKRRIESYAQPKGLFAFLRSLPARPRVLDIGCGNGSPARVKGQRPDAIYTGLDVGDHNQTPGTIAAADRYVTVAPEAFAKAILDFGQGAFDAVISNHNLEHCNAPAEVLEAIGHVTAPGGRLYLAFPSQASVNFPKREGTLNFYDDPTHREVPAWGPALQTLKDLKFDVTAAHRRYRPLIPALVGLAFEPWAARTGKLAPLAGTWALYGFESVIWARKHG